jgi:MFS family permease
MINRIHSGWFVLAAAAVGVFMTTPGQTVGVSSFVDFLATDTGLTRERVLVLYSVGTLLGILPAPLMGRLVDRHGPRRMVLFVALALGGACAAMGAAQGPWTLAFGFTLLRGTAIGGLNLTSLHMINLWFDRLRGRATSIAMVGLAAGGFVVPSVTEYVITGYGWRAAYWALGLAVVLVMLPVGLLFYRDRPQRYDVLPDFGREHTATGATKDVTSLTLREALRTRAFWYLGSIAFLVNAVGTALLLDHVHALQTAGAERLMAVQLLGVVALSQLLGTLSGGVLVDRFGARAVGFLGVMLLAFAVACLMTTPYVLAGFPYAVALGAMIGILQLVASAGLAEYFGISHMGKIRGTTFVVGVAGAAAGPLPLAWSPQSAYWIFLACAGLTVVLGGIAGRAPAQPRQTSSEADRV